MLYTKKEPRTRGYTFYLPCVLSDCRVIAEARWKLLLQITLEPPCARSNAFSLFSSFFVSPRFKLNPPPADSYRGDKTFDLIEKVNRKYNNSRRRRCIAIHIILLYLYLLRATALHHSFARHGRRRHRPPPRAVFIVR